MKKRIFALDADGVLLNYNRAFPGVYQKAFGKPLELIRPDAYHATNAYGLTLAKGTPEYDQFYAHFGYEAWSTMPVYDGVVEACHALHQAGYTLVCVTSMPPEFEQARMENLRAHGLPFEQVIATGRYKGINPKLEVLQQLQPVAFADDLAHNFHGLDGSVHKGLIDYGNYDSPNRTLDLSVADSTHSSLLEFVTWWLANKH
jgi:hypothetical protein